MGAFQMPGMLHGIVAQAVVGLFFFLVEAVRSQKFLRTDGHKTPPENRRPTDEEIKRYLPFLVRHIELINPKILLLLGSTALNALVGNEVVISKARGKWVNKKIGSVNPEVIASFHPAFLMRQPDQKKHAWKDLKMIRKKMSELKIKLNG